MQDLESPELKEAEVTEGTKVDSDFKPTSQEILESQLIEKPKKKKKGGKKGQYQPSSFSF